MYGKTFFFIYSLLKSALTAKMSVMLLLTQRGVCKSGPMCYYWNFFHGHYNWGPLAVGM